MGTESPGFRNATPPVVLEPCAKKKIRFRLRISAPPSRRDRSKSLPPYAERHSGCKPCHALQKYQRLNPKQNTPNMIWAQKKAAGKANIQNPPPQYTRPSGFAQLRGVQRSAGRASGHQRRSCFRSWVSRSSRPPYFSGLHLLLRFILGWGEYNRFGISFLNCYVLVKGS